jgi:hypothetical protein
MGLVKNNSVKHQSASVKSMHVTGCGQSISVSHHLSQATFVPRHTLFSLSHSGPNLARRVAWYASLANKTALKWCTNNYPLHPSTLASLAKMGEIHIFFVRHGESVDNVARVLYAPIQTALFG